MSLLGLQCPFYRVSLSFIFLVIIYTRFKGNQSDFNTHSQLYASTSYILRCLHLTQNTYLTSASNPYIQIITCLYPAHTIIFKCLHQADAYSVFCIRLTQTQLFASNSNKISCLIQANTCILSSLVRPHAYSVVCS